MKTKMMYLVLCIILFHLPSYADDAKNLKRRVEGHVQTMMAGHRTPLLTVKDYYSPIYITSNATIENVTKQANGKYLATIRFETIRRIHQDFEQNPMKRTEVKKKESIRVKLSFRVSPKSLMWTEKLETPFVKDGNQERYIIKMPAGKNPKSSSPSESPSEQKKLKPSSPVTQPVESGKVPPSEP